VRHVGRSPLTGRGADSSGRARRSRFGRYEYSGNARVSSRTSSRTDDVVFGVSTAGRPADLPGVETIVGLLINTLPLRVRVPGAAALVSWLQRVQENQTALQRRYFEPAPVAVPRQST